MIGFIGPSLYNLSLNYNQYSATTDLHNFQFTVAHALGFSVSTRRILATDLNTGTITSNHHEVFLSFLLQLPYFLTPYESVLGTTNSLQLCGADHTENTTLILLRCAEHIENTSTVA
jgi:hypothetical protein